MKQALGMIETRGLRTLVQAADAMLKAASVQVKGWNNIGEDLCALFVAGDVSAVEAAVEAGASAAKLLGAESVNVHIISQPHEDLGGVLHKFGMIRQNGMAEVADSDIEETANGMEEAVLAYGRPQSAAGETAPGNASTEIDRLFHSPEANAIKEEICAVGRKLWQRSYVDGNGGNISYRIGENAVICTPTLLSKADLRPEDLCLVDIDGNQLAGILPRTSEVFLHLEIFKHVSQAKAVVHCHPPHATAYAITGCVPPPTIIPEFDVFVGSVAISPYETPGTKKFAETVLPFVKNHNTILLGNHGVVCWADTPTHAEWYAENLETYCWTLLISRQLGVPYVKIPPEKEQDLLKIKKRLGLPDARFEMNDRETPDCSGAIALIPPGAAGRKLPSLRTLSDADIEAIAKAAVDAAIAAIKKPQER